MTNYASAFLVKQALGKAQFDVSDYFPVVGDTVQLLNKSEDNDSNSWTTRDGLNPDVSSTQLNESVVVSAEDGIIQELEISNTVSSDVHTETIYGLIEPDETYYDIYLVKRLARINEAVRVSIVSKYGQAEPHTVSMEITDSNTQEVVFTDPNVVDFVDVTFTNKAAYDIKIVSDTSGSLVERKIFRAITILPILEPIANAYIFTMLNMEDSTAYNGTSFNPLNGNNITIEPGRTIVLKLDQNGYSEAARYRASFENLVGTAQQPIVITVEGSLTMQYESWNGMSFVNCQHVILDGMGYSGNLNSLHITKHPDHLKGDACVTVGELSSDVEVCGVEFSESSFAGLVMKTDPNKDRPETWEANFRMYNTLIHNNYFHDVRAEGIYIGYFRGSTTTTVNSAGENVVYRAHKLEDTKIYNNSFVKCGWDSLQFNNGSGLCEVHDNYITNSAFFGEPDQNTGMSLSMSGKVFNNIVDGVKGLGIQIGPMGDVDIYNNILTNLGEGAYGLFLMGDKETVEQNTSGNTNQLAINIYNNTIITEGLGITLGAQNTVQHLNMIFKNNYYSSNSRFGGQSSSTIATWETNQENNIQLDMNNLDQYKIGSLVKGEFNIYSGSVLASGGQLIGEQYDSRGFKNWSDGDKFIGARAGIVKLSNSLLTLDSVLINNGNETSPSSTVSVEITFVGNPTQFRISEDPTFADAVWEAYSSNTIPFTLSGQGLISVYVQIRNDSVDSSTLSDAIEYTSDQQYLISLESHLVYSDTYLPNWNLFHALSDTSIPVGLESDFLFDQDAAVSTMKLKVDMLFDLVDNGNVDQAISHPYPKFALRKAWRVAADNPTNMGMIQVIGCDDTKLYDVVLYSRRRFAGENMIYEVNQVQQPFDTNGSNVFNQAVFSDVSPLSGVIDIHVINISHSSWLSVIDITEKAAQ